MAIANEDVGFRLGKQFGVVGQDEGKSMASNFAKMKKVRFVLEPGFKRGFVDWFGECVHGKIRRGHDEFIPPIWGEAALEAHSACFGSDGMVHMFNMANMCRGIGSSEGDTVAVGKAPVLSGQGIKLTTITT